MIMVTLGIILGIGLIPPTASPLKFKAGAQSGPAVQALKDPPEHFDKLRGYYRFSDGDFIVIGRSLGSLYYRQGRPGRTGPLRRVGDESYTGGPSIDVPDPPELFARFVPASGGRAGRVFVRWGAGLEREASRIAFYEELEVSFPQADIVLSGTLKLPPGRGARPAVVLLHGSNAQSRYGQYGFLEFAAEEFARNGIAVLAYDKRGVGKSTGTSGDVGLELDALAALRYLRGRRDIDPGRIGLWGISQGGMLAPLVADLDGSIAFIINVSGAVVHGHQQETERVERQMRADGFAETDIAKAVELQKRKFHYAATGKGWNAYITLADKSSQEAWFPDPYIGPPLDQKSPAWEVWRKGSGSLAPAAYWEKYRGPVLVVFGEHETYCNPETNLAAFREAMKKAGNARFEIRIMPSAEHAMRVARTGGPKELATLSRFVPGYFELIASWAGKVVSGREP
jgi:pimeloyl-ACP methyl ester carboxylesterase